MSTDALAQHLERPLGRGHTPASACTGAAGGAACGDLIRISLAVDPHSPEGRIVDAGFDASGCGAAIAAGSAAVSLVRGESLLTAARVGAKEIASELGGLAATKRHAAELAADALHRALGWAAREHANLGASPSRTLVAMSGGVDSAVAALLVCEGRDGAAAREHRDGGGGERECPVAVGGRDDGGERSVAKSEVPAPVEVVAVTLELWADPENDGERSCCSAQAVRAAREIAHGMGLAHFSIDLREEFRAGVVDGWLADHAAGLTPNPCVRCNGNVRLDAMLELADRLGASALATGHYARVLYEGSAGEDTAGEDTIGEDTAGEDTIGEDTIGEDTIGEDTIGEDTIGEDTIGEDTAGEDTIGKDTAGEDTIGEDITGDGVAGRPCGRGGVEPGEELALLDREPRLRAVSCGEPLLRVARDESKDQSYALAALSPESLARLRFPLGALTKPEVRELAARAGLAVARRPDSQDLCFLAGTRRVDFLERHGGLGRQAGPILDSDGRTLGEHGGVHTVTIGQRHGLGLGGGPPRYVIATDQRAGTVTVGSREQLLAGSVRMRDVVLHREGARVDGVKVRYRGRRMPCRVEGSPPPGTHARLELRMAERIERTAPGQVACLYAGDAIVGHGIVASPAESRAPTAHGIPAASIGSQTPAGL
jgi:tRNA U34 2-thiouridine synthase MnmA/TrmU/NifU-like protein involved in Fe-S cluster formation